MTKSKIFIPQLWQDEANNNLDDYAQKSELNNFILKNTDINMNNHVIENVKNKGSNDAVNKSYVDNQITAVNNLINSVNTFISSVQNKIPYLNFIKETVTGSETAVKTIQKSIVDPAFNGLLPENILLIPRFDYRSNEGPLNLNAKVVSINNNTLTFNIKIDNKYKSGWEVTVVVYVYIIIIHQIHIVSEIQNDEPQPNRSINELEHSDTTQTKSTNMANSYF